MGNCGSLYTTEYCLRLVEEPLDADADIVGPGVLAGFALTALVTIAAIAVGYFTDSLPGDYTNDSDTLFIEWARGNNLRPWVRRLGSRMNSLIRKVPLLSKNMGSKKSLSKEQRQEMLEKFILALSDQQLVTGIAVLVASFSAHCRISVYELNVAISLAWFSSATHLATLDVLQDYLRRNKVVRNWRMVGMISIVLLLIPGLIIGAIYTTGEVSVPIQCLQIMPNTESVLDPWAVIAIEFTIVYLILGYVNRLSRTFASGTGTSISITRLSLIRVLGFMRRLDAKDSANVVDEAIKIQKLRQARQYQNFVRKATSDTTPILVRQMFMFVICSNEYSETFVAKLGSLGFMLSYGLSQVASYRWLAAPPQLDPKSSRMDFGQIVPLVLLVIPILAAAEILYESPEQAKQRSKKNSATVSSGENPDEHSDRRSTHSEALPPPSPDVVATVDQSGYVISTAGAVDEPNSATTNDQALPLETNARGFRNSTNLDVQTHRETSPDHQEVLCSARAVGNMFIYKTIFNIGIGVSLNVSSFGFLFGAVGMVLIFGPDWVAWFMRLSMIVSNIFIILRDKNFAPDLAIPGTEGQSTEMHTSPQHSVADTRGSNVHTTSSPPASMSHESTRSGAAYHDTDRTEFTRPNRQDTEARIGDSPALSSIGITRRGTSGLLGGIT